MEQGTFDLVVADLAMPGMTGVEFAEIVRARWSDVPVLIVTGHAEAIPIPPTCRCCASPSNRPISRPKSRASSTGPPDAADMAAGIARRGPIANKGGPEAAFFDRRTDGVAYAASSTSTGPESLPRASTSRSTNSMTARGALSP